MNNPMQMMQMVQQFKANPMQMLSKMKFNVPQNINVNDPNAILNHLMQTNQISQAQVNQAYQWMQRMGGK